MAESWPLLAVIDADDGRRRRIEALTHALGVRGRGLSQLPRTPSHGMRQVALVLHVGDIDADAMHDVRAGFPAARIVIAGLSPAQETAVTAFRAGADDFIWLGAGETELATLVAGHLSRFAEAPTAEPHSDHGFVGVSAAMAGLRAFIRKLAPTSATVLITGETGTGKDCIAALLHRQSRRAKGPLVALNCAAIPDALIEGELFGYERGAFSGAHAAYPGKLKLADGGTLLLDEIGELSLGGQAKVLRAIETREAYRLGARTPTRFDARIIAATNRDLATEMQEGRFREDLFYRLAVSQLHLPPLRDRPEDIGPIAVHLLSLLAQEAERPFVRLDDAALRLLCSQSWPGNARELRNAIEVGLINARGDRIRAVDLPLSPARWVTAGTPEDERARLIKLLDAAHGNKSLAAQRINCSRMTLYRRLQRSGLSSRQDSHSTTL